MVCPAANTAFGSLGCPHDSLLCFHNRQPPPPPLHPLCSWPISRLQETLFPLTSRIEGFDTITAPGLAGAPPQALSSQIHFYAVSSPVGLVKLVGGSISAFEDPKRTSFDHFKAIKVCSLPSFSSLHRSIKSRYESQARLRSQSSRSLPPTYSPRRPRPRGRQLLLYPRRRHCLLLSRANSANTEIFRAFCHHRATGREISERQPPTF